jgi:hypothetical protein
MGAANIETKTDAYRIYTDPNDRQVQRPTNIARGTLPLIEVPIETARPSRTEPVIALAIEQQLIAILTAERQGGETIELAYKRKEHDLAAVFAGLSHVQARALHVRLLAARGDDALASHFARLIEARRIRLLAFLIIPRR